LGLSSGTNAIQLRGSLQNKAMLPSTEKEKYGKMPKLFTTLATKSHT